MLARVLGTPAWKDDAIPVIYLPGVSRAALRDIETCPKPVKPIAELQYRGVFWSQTNTRDWSVFAFLRSKDGGLGLDVAQDEQTATALSRAILPLADTHIDALQGRLEAADFDRLLTPDPVRDLLGWLNDPKITREQWGDSRWQAFRDRCKRSFAFDPQTDGELAGAEHLGRREGEWKLAWRIDEEIRELVERVVALFDAGWKSLKIVTDHGWLLIPGGLPKTDLPQYLTETRWGRCAVLKPDAQPGAGVRVVPWRWHEGVTVALAPGISNYYVGSEYAHGGLSLQECVTPYLVVSNAGPAANVVIQGVTWQGMRCRVRVAGASAGHRVDLRTKAADAGTSLANGGKAVDPSGTTSVVIADDDKLGDAVFAVVLDATGALVAKIATPVGGD